MLHLPDIQLCTTFLRFKFKVILCTISDNYANSSIISSEIGGKGRGRKGSTRVNNVWDECELEGHGGDAKKVYCEEGLGGRSDDILCLG